MIDLQSLTIKKAREALDAGEFTAVELTQAYLDVIAEKNGDINAYLEVFDDAIKQAEQADEMIKKGEVKELTGIPFAIKDNILIKGKIASAGSKILENYTATYDATVIKKLKNQHAVLLGRANMDEFAMGTSNEQSAFGIVKNPHDTSCVPGGSSGGPAAAVAMNGALAALGTDTGGSVRQPAGFCGAVGFKSTYGALSRYGMMAMAASLNQVGTVAKTVEDTKILYNVLSGHDPMDSMSFSDELLSKIDTKKIKTIGVPKGLSETKGLDEEVAKNFKESIEKLKNLGFEITEVELPDPDVALAAYYIIMPAEISTDLARYDGVRYGLREQDDALVGTYMKTRGAGFGTEVKRRIMLGTYVLSAGYFDAYYGKATQVRSYLAKKYKELFEEVDILAMPTSPTPAFKIGEKADDPLALYLADLFTVTANLVGVPAIAVPSGTTKGGLPLSMQFVAPHHCEERLFTIGKEFEGSV